MLWDIMRLTKISLDNFRNYSKIEVVINSDLVLILGSNAAGKTNLLEALYYLSTLKSFRGPDQVLVKTGEGFFRLAADGETKLEVVVQIHPVAKKSLKIDGVKTPRALWQGPTAVLFVPQDLNLFILGPQLRRRFLDEILGQVSKAYAVQLISLDHVLKQRRAVLERLLAGQASVAELAVFNEQLADLAVAIDRQRQGFVDFLAQRFAASYGEFTGFSNKFELDYRASAISPEQFLQDLAKAQAQEIRMGQNLLGPHREDFLVIKDKQLNLHNSSQGELRCQILVLKLLQARFLDERGQPPIILLDDVFSELDEERREKLLQNLSGHQIFITSTEEHHLPKLGTETQILKVENGQIV